MLKNNTILSFLIKIQIKYLTSFSLTASLVLIIIYYLKINFSNPLNQDLFIIFGIVLGHIGLINYSLTREETVLSSVFRLIIPYVFFISLSTIVFSSPAVNILSLDQLLFKTILVISIISGAYTLSVEKKDLRKKISCISNNKVAFFLILLSLLAFVVRFILATKIPLHIDEAYTDLVTKGLFKYHEMAITESGISYGRSVVYNLTNSISYFIFEDTYLKLRFLNIILFSTSIAFLYSTVKSLTENKQIALLTVFFTSINWYIILISVIARSYGLAILLEIITVYLLVRISKTKDYRRKIALILMLVTITFLNYTQATNLGVYHLFPLFIPILYLYSKNLSVKHRIYTYFCFLLLTSLFIFYVTRINTSISKMFIDYFNPELNINQLINLASFNFYPHMFGLAILISALIASLNYKKKDKFMFILSTWIIGVAFFQGYLYGSKSFDFRYFFSLLIPITFLHTYYAYHLWQSTGIRKLTGATIFIIMIGTSIFNITNMYSGDLDWRIQTPQPWGDFLKGVPENSIVLTDYPILVRTLREDLTIYKLSYHPKDNELLNRSMTVPYPKQEFTNMELSRFFHFVDEQNIKLNTAIANNQEYDIYTASPKIMSHDHLNEILEANLPVYALITYDIHKHQSGYPEIYKIISDGEYIKERFIDHNVYDDRSYPDTDSLSLVKIQ